MAFKLSDWIRQRNLIAGIILSLAILDHTRLFFHYWNTKPADLSQPDLALFLTRFSAHFFAPAAFLLTGIELYLKGIQRSKAQNAKLWLRNGIALTGIEVLINNFLYTFDPCYRTIGLYIIGMIGISMIILALLQYLPVRWLTAAAMLIIIMHHNLDFISASGHSFKTVLWYILHQQKHILQGSRLYTVNYTLLPWAPLLWLGYGMGRYIRDTPQELIKKNAVLAGLVCCTAFFILRSLNSADPATWEPQSSLSGTLISYGNITKYPASLCYLCITTGPLCWLFAFTLKSGRSLPVRFFTVLGTRPLMVYLVSTLIIHLAAMPAAEMQGLSWRDMIITASSYTPGSPLYRYGISLIAVYGIWPLMLLIQYALCLAINVLKNNMRRYKPLPVATAEATPS